MTHSDRTSKIVISPHGVLRNEFPTHAMPDFYGRFHDFLPIKSDANPKRVRSQVWRSSEFTLGQVQNGAAAIERSRQKSEEGAHLLTLQCFTGGSVHGFLGNLNVDRYPGNMYLFDIANRVKCVQFPHTQRCIYVPKSAIGYQPGIHPPLLKFPLSTPMGTALQTQLFKIFSQVSETDQFDRAAFDQIIALLKVAINSEDQDLSSRQLAQKSLREMIQSHIEANLTSPALSLSSILHTYGASRASLFRMFESYGGVRRYINDRRLYHAVFEISRRQMVRGSLSEAAEKWGFSSNANFNRAVKRAFGAAPSAFVYSNPTGTRASTVDDTRSMLAH